MKGAGGCTPGSVQVPAAFWGIAGTLEYIWLDQKDANGNWIPNPAIPQKGYVNNLQNFRFRQFYDQDGKPTQGRSVAGFSFQGITYTQDPGRNNAGSYVRAILAPTIDVLDAPAGVFVDAQSPWRNFVECCDNLPTPPENTPPVHGCDYIYKGFWTLGYPVLGQTFDAEGNPCGPRNFCCIYSKGPMKVGYLYGYAGDINGANRFPGQYMQHDLQLESVGGCKLQLTGNLPYSPGFTNPGSPAPADYINSRVPSDTYIFLDGGRAVRVKLNTWFATLTDYSFSSTFYGPGYFMNQNGMELFWNHPVQGGGEDPAIPWYKAGFSLSSVLPDGTVVWGNSNQYVSGQNYWQMRWFDDNQKDPVNLVMVVKVWYYIAPVPPAPAVDDPNPDPWSIGIDEFQTGYLGCRPPDDCVIASSQRVRTCVAAGQENPFSIEPTYTSSPGFTWSVSKSLNNILWSHFAFYHNGVLVGQQTMKNESAPKAYEEATDASRPLTFQNRSDEYPKIQRFPSCANLSIYPYGALGEDQFPFATMNLMSRSGTTMTFTPVYPTNVSDGKGGFLKAEVNWGDGSATVQVPPLVAISHTFPASGQYPVSITFDGKVSTTNFLTG